MTIDTDILTAALRATCRKRESESVLPRYSAIINELEASDAMRELWQNYQKKNSYASGITWSDVIAAVRTLCDTCIEAS